MKHQKTLVFLLLIISSLMGQKSQIEQDWIRLFNGKNLDGWKIKIAGYKLDDNFNETFKVENNVLKVSYDNYKNFNRQFGHIFYQAPFSDYILRLEYRFLGEQVKGGPNWAYRNSGIMVHSQSPESMHIGQEFPVSIEIQLLGGNGIDNRSTANVCTPGTNVVMNDELITKHCTDSHSETYHGDQWVNVEIEVHGNSLIKHKVNEKLVLDYSKPQYDENDEEAKKLFNSNKMLNGGYISLQAESHPVEFRNIEIFPLTK